MSASRSVPMNSSALTRWHDDTPMLNLMAFMEFPEGFAYWILMSWINSVKLNFLY
jgi:hypothetical protein